MKKRISLIFIIAALFSDSCLAQETKELDKIFIRRQTGREYLANFLNNRRSQTILTQDIREKSVSSFIDLLDNVPGVDLRYRGTFGIQADMSLRGSTYEQVGVLVDGVKLMDSQTGHHNMDIPLTAFDIEKIDIVKEGTSSLYGAGPLAGSVSIVTKKSRKKSFDVEFITGENALFGEGFSLSIPHKDMLMRMSFDHKLAKAARPNTDFEYGTGTIYLSNEFNEDSNADFFFGYQKKDFGADSFYSNLFPEEEEHTRTQFFKAGLSTKINSKELKNNIYLRKHEDKFILRRNVPSAANCHTSYSYGFNSEYDIPLEYGGVMFGLSAGDDQINSNNLGVHSRLFEAGLLGLSLKTGSLSSDFNFRLDHYQKWGVQDSYGIAAGYNIMEEILKIKGSYARSFRIPSFTELYYSDAANKGNTDLKEEYANNFKLGAEFKKKIVLLSLEGFLRQGRNLIDWTRPNSSSVWQATNLGRIDFKGIEFDSSVKPQVRIKGFELEKISFSYSYTHADQKAGGFLSKYALDILKNQYLLGINTIICGVSFNWQCSYNQRYYDKSYFVGSIYIGKKISGRNFTFEPYLKIDNFSNTDYTEVGGVIQPGRWIKTGLRLHW